MQAPRSIRAFIGSKDFTTSRAFYRDLGFSENEVMPNLSVFTLNGLSFYLQDYYVKEWMDNTMMLLEVENAKAFWNYLEELDLQSKFEGVKLIPVQLHDWGKECMLIDPGGVLWHFAEFNP